MFFEDTAKKTGFLQNAHFIKFMKAAFPDERPSFDTGENTLPDTKCTLTHIIFILCTRLISEAYIYGYTQSNIQQFESILGERITAAMASSNQNQSDIQELGLSGGTRCINACLVDPRNPTSDWLFTLCAGRVPGIQLLQGLGLIENPNPFTL
jgi:hypothetical protein